jgi:hypothetical protein
MHVDPMLLLPHLVMVFASATAFAATNVSGPQTGTWTLANSPYHLLGDVTVPAGQLLNIQPGVEVIAQGYFRIQVEPDATLRAVGSPQAMILFTAANPTTGWRGLRFVQSSNDSLLIHCIVEYGRGTGDHLQVAGGNIYIRECSPRVANCIIRYGSSSNANANGRGAGICMETSQAIIEDNQIVHNTGNSGSGVFAGLSSAGVCSPIIRRNYIAHNTATYAGGGIYMGAGTSPTVATSSSTITVRDSAEAGSIPGPRSFSTARTPESSTISSR